MNKVQKKKIKFKLTKPKKSVSCNDIVMVKNKKFIVDESKQTTKIITNKHL